MSPCITHSDLAAILGLGRHELESLARKAVRQHKAERFVLKGSALKTYKDQSGKTSASSLTVYPKGTVEILCRMLNRPVPPTLKDRIGTTPEGADKGVAQKHSKKWNAVELSVIHNLIQLSLSQGCVTKAEAATALVKLAKDIDWDITKEIPGFKTPRNQGTRFAVHLPAKGQA